MTDEAHIEKSVVISDLHIPYEDKNAVDLVMKFIAWFKPDRVFLNGDIADMFEISKFDKDPLDCIGLIQEFRLVNEFLLRLRNISPDAKIIYVEGNHELRWLKYIIKNAKELRGLPGLSYKEQVKINDLGIEYIESKGREAAYQYGIIWIGHFNKVNKFSSYTAKNLVEDKDINLIHGHTHRLGSYFKTCYDGKQLVGYENGCLCDLRPCYVANPNWQHGFSVIYKRERGNRFQVINVPIVKYKFFFGDNEFSG